MLVITITDLVSLVYIAGLSGGYVFIAISVNFLTTYVVLWKTIKVTEKGDSRDRKEQVPKEEIPRLAIENETEDNEESENAGIEMSLLTAATSKDFEGQELEQQAQAKPDDEKEAGGVQVPTPTEMPNIATGISEDIENKEESDDAQMPPSTELPGAGKDIESQEEEQQSEAKTEEKAKEEEESFLFAASVCSTWIPSVVGDPEQRFFLKAGEVFDLSLLCRNPLYLSKLPRCCEPRHEKCLPCRCDHPRPLWNPQGASVSSPLR